MTVAYSIILALVALSDLWRFRIPNVLVLAVVGLFFAWGLLHPYGIDWTSHLGAGLLMLGAGVVLFGLGLMGAGDSKFLAATALWTGLEQLPAHVVGTAVLGLGLVLILVILRRACQLLGLWRHAAIAAVLPQALASDRCIPYGIAIALSALLVQHGVLDGLPSPS